MVNTSTLTRAIPLGRQSASTLTMARLYRQVGKVQVVEPLGPRAEPPLILIDLEAPCAAVRVRVRVPVRVRGSGSGSGSGSG